MVSSGRLYLIDAICVDSFFCVPGSFTCHGHRIIGVGISLL